MIKKPTKKVKKEHIYLLDTDTYMQFSEFLDRFEQLYQQRLESERQAFVPETIIIDNATGKIIR